MNSVIPRDPVILLSYVNLKLRDYYKSLDEMCAALGVDKGELVGKLGEIGYEYDEGVNQFT